MYIEFQVGCRFRREPEGSTERYTEWLNSLSIEGLTLQRFRELTIIAPTWAMRREVLDKVGPFLTPFEPPFNPLCIPF